MTLGRAWSAAHPRSIHRGRRGWSKSYAPAIVGIDDEQVSVKQCMEVSPEKQATVEVMLRSGGELTLLHCGSRCWRRQGAFPRERKRCLLGGSSESRSRGCHRRCRSPGRRPFAYRARAQPRRCLQTTLRIQRRGQRSERRSEGSPLPGARPT